MAKLLLNESDRALRDTLPPQLRRGGFEVIVADDARHVMALARAHQPDVVVLDVATEGPAGYAICRNLRQELHTPVILLTGNEDRRATPEDAAHSADGFLAKPLILSEFLEYLESVLRCPRPIPQAPIVFRSGDLWLDMRSRNVVLAGRPLALTAKEFHLLAEFMKHKGVLLTRDELLQRVWGANHNGDRRTLDVHISWLRRKIESDHGRAARIRTIRNLGFRFEG